MSYRSDLAPPTPRNPDLTPYNSYGSAPRASLAVELAACGWLTDLSQLNIRPPNRTARQGSVSDGDASHRFLRHFRRILASPTEWNQHVISHTHALTHFRLQPARLASFVQISWFGPTNAPKVKIAKGTQSQKRTPVPFLARTF